MSKNLLQRNISKNVYIYAKIFELLGKEGETDVAHILLPRVNHNTVVQNTGGKFK